MFSVLCIFLPWFLFHVSLSIPSLPGIAAHFKLCIFSFVSQNACVCVCVCACVRVRALRIVSRDKILRFKND